MSGNTKQSSQDDSINFVQSKTKNIMIDFPYVGGVGGLGNPHMENSICFAFYIFECFLYCYSYELNLSKIHLVLNFYCFKKGIF